MHIDALNNLVGRVIEVTVGRQRASCSDLQSQRALYCLDRG